jgi:hypothetical protein
VEGEHRKAAWDIVIHHVPHRAHDAVVGELERTLEAWLVYRDAVALACGLQRS